VLSNLSNRQASLLRTYLEPEEVKLLEEEASCLRDRLLVRLLFRTGCRVSEALALKVDDIDFARGTVMILHLKSYINLSCPNCRARLGRRHKFCPVCGQKVVKAVSREAEHRRMRTLPLDHGTLEPLRDYVKRGGPVVRNDQWFVFGINRHRAWQIVKDCAQRAGLSSLTNPETGRTRGISPHRLRDAFAVHAVRADDSGDGLRLLQEHLGHASFNTTAKYRKIGGSEHREWYQKLWEEKDR
jgi:integrase/recombinase XerD